MEFQKREWKLPSLGLFYKDMNLVNGHSIVLRPLVAGDQRYLTTGSDSYLTYSSLLSRIVVEPKGLDFSQLLLEDVNSIVIGTRIVSYGPLYSMPFMCVECGAIDRNHKVMLDTLNITFADEKADFMPTGLKMKVNDHELTYHLTTLKDIKAINSQIAFFRRSKRLKNESLDPVFITLCQKIDEIDGKDVTFEDKFTFLEQLPQLCFDEISEEFVKTSIGPADTISTTCTACNMTQDAGFVTTSDFFRPNR